MYEQLYGLDRRPFRAAATGSDVFVGPQTAKTMQALKKALDAGDAAVAVSGATGVGKTTLVNRALEAMSGNLTVIRIGRMQIGHDEVLDFLLDELQADNVPASTIRKITHLRTLLGQRKAAGERVVVVIEDAVRIGIDALVEIEALTAADGGECEGANLVLMGDDELRTVIDGAALKRLKQRIRLNHNVLPLTPPELLGYLRHCFRLSGSDFDRIFDANSGATIHALTEGVARIANNLVESALNAGGDREMAQIGSALIARVAEDEYGLTAELPPPAPSAATPAADTTDARPLPIPAVEPAPAAEKATVAEAAAPAEPAATPTPEPEPAPIPAVEPQPAAEPASTGHAESTPTAADPASESLDSVPDVPAAPAPAEPEPVIPDLIQDTLPDLEVLAPEVMQASAEADAGAARTADVEVTTEPDVLIVPDPSAPPPIEAASATASDTAAVDVAAEGPSPAEPVLTPPADPEPESPTAESAEPSPAAQADSAEEPDAIAAMLAEVPEHDSDDAVPTLFDSSKIEQPAADAAAAADRDPTLAELKPDLDALEAAMAGLAEEGSSPEPDTPDLPELTIAADTEPTLTEPASDVSDRTIPELPTISLDKSIEDNIAEAEAALDKHDATIAEDTSNEESSKIAAAAPKNICLKSTTELRHIATGLQRAESLDDIDDAMAETLFGTGITTIAAKVLAAGPDQEPANEPVRADSGADAGATSGPDLELALVDDESAPAPEAAAAAPAAAESPAMQKTELEKEFMDVYGDNALEVSLESDAPKSGLDSSASQRLATVRALNADKPVAGTRSVAPSADPQSAAPPASFEDQIKSMDQELSAAASRPTAVDHDDDDDDDEEPKKRGFFSRFRLT